MTRFVGLVAGFSALVATSLSVAQTAIVWQGAVANGNWEFGSDWVGGKTPGNNDFAAFNSPGVFNIAFGVQPAAIQNLEVDAGAVTFASRNGPKTLNFLPTTTSTVTLPSANTSLILGAPIDPINLSVGKLRLAEGSTIEARFGSQITANVLGDTSPPVGMQGTIRVDGIGSSLTEVSSGNVGVSGSAAVIFQNGSSGSLPFTGVADISNVPSVANVSVLSGSSVTGSFRIATQPMSGTGTLTINGAGSSVSGSLVVGSSAVGTSAAVDIGTTISGGTLSATSLSIGASGTVTVGSGETPAP